ncbi:hypothetical protein [Rhizobium rhizoryzae]|uniref:hypothetical protein n=1 Tax=Rhizobium rhizoryzae TaxID=451876 RepID=UPI0028A0BF7B|nr:hypothetical protein [Rhizobium rhizoryzae]
MSILLDICGAELDRSSSAMSETHPDSATLTAAASDAFRVNPATRLLELWNQFISPLCDYAF